MQTRQEHLVSLVTELCDLAGQLYKTSHDPIIFVFGIPFAEFSAILLKDLHNWSALDEDSIQRLKSGKTNYLLDLKLLDQLSGLLLDEFGHSLEIADTGYVEHIHDLCQEIRALLNEAMERPRDARLSTKLDSPATRHKLNIEFDRVLCTPVQQMIEGTEQLLTSDTLSEQQRGYTESALKNARNLHRVLQTAQPLIETQNFRAMAMLSHQYRSPFCGLTGFYYLLLKHENEGFNELQIDQLRDLTSYGRTVLGMINNLLDATKILVGKPFDHPLELVSLSQDKFRIKEWAEQDLQIYPHLSLEIHCSPGLPPVMTSDFYLRGCLIHLLDNAFKYTPEGSVCLDVAVQDRFVAFRVQDTGIGIPQDQLERIFEPFTQVGDQSKGLGLGLFLARKFAESMRGSLTVESQVGLGCTFTLRIPVASKSLQNG